MTPLEALAHARERAEQARQVAHAVAEALRETAAKAAQSLPPTDQITGTEESPR